MKKIFVVGDLCVDVLCKTKKYAKAGEEAYLDDLTFSLGGNAANFAFASAKLGMKPELFSAIGKDFSTGFLKEELRSVGIKSSLKQMTLENAYSIILVGQKGERAIYSGKGVLEEITARDIERMLLPKLKKGSIVFFGAYYHLRGIHKGFLKLLRKIKEKQCFIAFDLCFDAFGKWKLFPFLKYIDLLFLNTIELAHVAHKRNEKDAINLLFKKGASKIVLKRGPKGARFFSPNVSVNSSAFRRKAVDTTGAGDIFNAAFMKAYLKGLDTEKALKFANFAAAQKISKHGLFMPAKRILNKKLVTLT